MVTQATSFDIASTSFLNYLQIERGLATNTITAYRRDLIKFHAFLKDTELKDVTPSVIQSFESSLRQLDLSVAAINRMNSTLRAFFRYLEQEY